MGSLTSTPLSSSKKSPAVGRFVHDPIFNEEKEFALEKQENEEEASIRPIVHTVAPHAKRLDYNKSSNYNDKNSNCNNLMIEKMNLNSNTFQMFNNMNNFNNITNNN
jgi:hypothetical protein